MRSSRRNPSSSFRYAGILLAFGLVGCGDFCIAGFSNNGNGSVLINASNPAPACSLPKVMGTMKVVVQKSPPCEMCPAIARVEHLYVTLQSIRLRPGAVPGSDWRDWPELVPHFANDPLQIDLVGESPSAILLGSANIPAGSYTELRLQFLSEPGAPSAQQITGDRCGAPLANCIVMADSHVEPFRWPAGPPELAIPLGPMSKGPLIVLPDDTLSLQIRLEPQLAYVADAGGWKTQNVLVGNAEVVRQSSAPAEGSALE